MPLKIDSVDPKATALLVIDMENDFVRPGAPFEVKAALEILPKLKKLIAFCRRTGIKIIYTTHVHRADGSDMGRFADLYPAIADRVGLVDGTAGIEIFSEIAPRPGEIVVKKHRYSAFYGTDLDVILRGLGVDTVIIAGVTTEDCCHATARDAMFRDYKVAFLSDCTGTYAYPDLGYGDLSAEEVHRSSLIVLALSTGHVMTADELMARVREPVQAKKVAAPSGSRGNSARRKLASAG
jgi:ureidoacrylate peracid hydrolase